jgi:flagellar motor switch protein FliG
MSLTETEVPAAKPKEVLSGPRRAAILLIVLGEQSSAELVKGLTEDEVQIVGSEIARLHTITSEQAEAVLEEFYQMVAGREFVMRGGLDYAKKMLHGAFGPEASKRIYDRLLKVLGNDVANFDVLHKADPQQLAKFIHNEHPQTIALVLSHLSPSQAAALLVSLPPEARSDVALRMANLDQISPEIVAKIASVIGEKLLSLGEFSRASYGGVRAVSEMFNRLDSGASKEILDTIQPQNPNLVETIRHLMFVFEDLLLIDSVGVRELTSRVDRKLLTLALKGTSDRLRDHLMQGMSQRGSEMLKEDMDAMGPVKIKDVEAAQQSMITMVRKLEAEGVINLKGSVGEQYVE